MHKPVRVAIAAKVFIEWSGGVDFITYLANAVAQNPDFKVFFLVPDTPGPLEIRVETEKDAMVYKSNFLKNFLKKYKGPTNTEGYSLDSAFEDLDKSIEVIYYKNDAKGFINCLRQLKAEIVMPTTSPFGPAFPLSWIGYVWDYQHKYFPEYFNEDELKTRDIIFNRTMSESPAVIVNSQATEKDLRNFISKYSKTKKIFTLPFAPFPVKSWLEADGPTTAKKYKLNKPYFIVCNQFWLHKSHETVIKAMAKVIEANPKLHLVCTGKMEEPRSPEYITHINGLVKKLGLSKNVHFLGLVPKEDQIALLKQSIALVQPTLYEGGPGGGAAYNAVALGVPVIASDIPVNLEMREELVTFFKTKSTTDLSKKMLALASSPQEEPSNQQLIEAGAARSQELCKVLTDSISYAIAHHGGKL